MMGRMSSTGPRGTKRKSRLSLCSSAVVGLMLLSGGCSGLQGTDDANFVTGSGSIVQIVPAKRDQAVDIAGRTLDGDVLDLADLRGRVVVLNIWGSWCPPCRQEAPVLKQASDEVDAAFVGLSFRETSQDNARNFEREFGIEYPTITDEEQVLALGDHIPLSPPTTYVLDEQGRVAAIFTGALTSGRTLEDIVVEVAAEE